MSKIEAWAIYDKDGRQRVVLRGEFADRAKDWGKQYGTEPVPLVRATAPAFDMNAPFDAPLRRDR